MSILSRLLEELERDEAGRRRLARLLAVDIASEDELRMLVANAVLREVATKGDLRELEERMEKRIERLERELREELRRVHERIDGLQGSIHGLTKWVVGLLASMWLTLVALLLPILLKLLGVAG